MTCVQAVRTTLQSFPELELGIIYGSAASGRMTPASDIDIAAFAGHRLPWERCLSTAQAVEKATGRDVDLVDMYALHGPLLHQIFAHGIIVLNRSSQAKAYLLKRLWYDREDMLPLTRYVMRRQIERYFGGHGRHSQ